jgi:hypothetical protein
MRSGGLKIVRAKCPNLCRELGLYVNDPLKPDSEEPVDANNHAVDAMRYRVVGHLRRRGRYAGSADDRLTEGQRVVREMAQQQAEEEQAKAEAEAEIEERKQLDKDAQLNPDDPRWWNE